MYPFLPSLAIINHYGGLWPKVWKKGKQNDKNLENPKNNDNDNNNK